MKFPIGVQDFKSVIEGGYVYVDKSVALAGNNNDTSLRFYKTDGNFVDICVCNYSNIKKDE